VRGELIAEYVRRHSPVRSAMLFALRDAGWNNYSIFLRPDGLVVGYFEADDLKLALNRIETMEANARWQEDSAPLFEPGRLVWLPQVFNLEEQLTDL
jgi:L-rhamnose mutarotase